jgi:hypothetical protein
VDRSARISRRARRKEVRSRSSGDIDVFSPEEVLALVRAAGDEQDAAIEAVRRGRSITCCRRLGAPGSASVHVPAVRHRNEIDARSVSCLGVLIMPPRCHRVRWWANDASRLPGLEERR